MSRACITVKGPAKAKAKAPAQTLTTLRSKLRAGLFRAIGKMAYAPTPPIALVPAHFDLVPPALGTKFRSKS